ncbi:bifunctional biotin--[acetyl-CoA-carboxylase] ligase/biotin operon repressor BirA [Aestuariicella hydrocarbonica]|uniref:Bifunctional ligase/repressor BirA n=1 Tax=Pseudomaricurvus hydrocarbonicus TaxID=1470433 RepID=A0A9E5MKB8_9GAMM|nr:bifunctional biotin--[acetyl-CoA-carboxylase] ligase/biotin operon repressor BirA [Aestuariicella hydrocarbonica]NHO66294.1 bifunctional biotin--[acetyl-CoA-carboxylase] ligase/biotin operon repressor BirA [Aestuariicella hydrocarbonica]
MNLQAILTLMADGEFHSGKVLGELLGVSRTAVWKHLQKLEAYGIPLESVKGKGYRLPGGIELLDPERIESGLAGAAKSFLSELDVRQSVDSTNVQAMARAGVGGGHGYVCLAEHQTAGRGRRGRTWVSPFGQSLYCSVVAEFDGGAAALEGLSLAVGVALVRALRRLGAEGVGLKWPNDVLWQGRKLAGVLLEMTGDPAGVCQVVVGLGLNVRMAAQSAEGIDQPWADMSQILPQLSRNELATAVLDELLPLLAGYHVAGFTACRDEWEAVHVFAGREVTLMIGNEVVSGVALGVTNSGALRLAIGDTVEEFNGGEVSLRAAD